MLDNLINENITLPDVPQFMTSDECKDMCDYSQGMAEPDIMLYASLIVNGLLFFSTTISELMAASKCKANSFFELVIFTLKGKSCRDNIEDNNIDEPRPDEMELEEV